MGVEDDYWSAGAVAERLTQRYLERDHNDDSLSWEQTSDYVEFRAKKEKEGITAQKINKELDAVLPDRKIMAPSARSNAWKVHDVFPDVFYSGIKKSKYSYYRLIANGKLSREQKDELRELAESDNPPTRDELVRRIKELRGDDDAIRRGFRLMSTNHWRFGSEEKDDNGWDGGISKHVVANLIHYYTDPGDIVIDPMAGSGRTGKVVETMPYFSADWENGSAEYGGPRTVLMSDIDPQRDGIEKADARERIPFAGASLVLLDPPYWNIAKDKYATGGDTLEEWLETITAIGIQCKEALKPGGAIAFICDDYLRSKERRSLSLLAAMEWAKIGLSPRETIYNTYNNASATMGPLGQWRAKNARLMVNGTKIITMFYAGDTQ